MIDVEAAAVALGIPLRHDWIDGVRTNLEISLRLGAEVAAFHLDDEVELAPVFAA